MSTRVPADTVTPADPGVRGPGPSTQAGHGPGPELRRRTSTRYAGDLRRDLLDEALRVVSSDGPSSVTLRALARRLGVSHAAPANHFPDKTALFTAIAVEGFTLLERAMSQATGDLPASSAAVDRLRAAGTTYMRFAVTYRGHFEVMWRNDLLHVDDPALVAAGEATMHQLVEGVHAAQSEGWAPGADPRTLTYLAWSAIHGLAALWLGGPLQEHEDRAFEHIADTVCDLLTAAFLTPLPEAHLLGSD